MNMRPDLFKPDNARFTLACASRRNRERPTLLLAEDQKFSRQLVAGILGDEFEIHTAHNGVEALQLYENLAPDIVFLDINMPLLDGLTALGYISSMDDEAFVLMVTASDAVDDIDTASICLPVPAGHNYTAAAPDSWTGNGKAPTLFAIAETGLTFDRWQLLQQFQNFTNLRAFKAESDGFVFCSLEARNDGSRGFVTCEVDKVLIAAASVHNYAYSDDRITNACFCAPYAKGSTVEVRMTETSAGLSR